MDDMFKEQLDNMIREAVYGAIEKMGIDVNFKELPNSSKLEKLIAKKKSSIKANKAHNIEDNNIEDNNIENDNIEDNNEDLDDSL